jgi:uroporphyrin-III C-methyltransferase/precorrin-2 dehydrogenase/sirohydrochlorin ferrochelatase
MPKKEPPRSSNSVSLEPCEAEAIRAIASAAYAHTSRTSGACLAESRCAWNMHPEAGRVTLVGAGPGDPDLLTLRAVRALMGADVVVYDHLVNAGILDLAPQGAEMIYAGKQASRHTLSQDEISKLLVALAGRGAHVVRLKGGDPFIFGRGGEEVEFLFEHGVPFEVVPGITAASGAASYAGIPLTHRDYAQCCVFVTGHIKPGGGDIDWAGLARPRQTLVIYMGLGQIAEICRQLIVHGMSAEMPAAVIERATTPQQRVLSASLRELPGVVAQARCKSPSLILVGEVVRLHAKFGASAPERARYEVHGTPAFAYS